MTSSDGRDPHPAGPRSGEDPREAEERVGRSDQQPADRRKQREDGEKRRAEGETQRADADPRAEGKAADAQHAPEQRGSERIEAPGAELAPAEHAQALDDHERAMQRRDREDPDVLLDIPIVKV
ncbi:MAG TPA: hypothetical protein VF516_25850, partial [Kofleriaceae bacterium]